MQRLTFRPWLPLFSPEKRTLSSASGQIDQIESFSFLKKVLQKIGSAVVRFVSKTDISDAPSGFRAMSREAALRINVFNDYTYTLETIIQAARRISPSLRFRYG